ncbi:3'-5' exonuclease [Ceratobasidium sp. AG-Ba]|nr:3'-5' exonuclease [Ceratobasidium sp. AG-Ba]
MSTHSSDSETVPVPSPTDLAAYTARLQSAIVAPTRLVSTLPTGSSLAYDRTLDRTAAKELDAVSNRILSLVDRIAQYAGGKGKGKALSADDLIDGGGYKSLVSDVLDQLLENADTCLDEFSGKNKAPAIVVNEPASKPSRPRRLDPSLLHAAHLPKPQLKFRVPPDNTPLTSPYVPPPHPDPQPYVSSPPQSLLNASPPAPIASFDSTPFTFVDTPAQLASMVQSFTDENITELAVDLEHHSLRTYKGIVCLIQISTRTQDWVVDALALRDEIGPALNRVLRDPRIVKVLHGAESDIIWLQRDFGLYVVGLFDTYHASKILGFPKHGLAALLARYTDFIPDKQYQLADWRIRPLPEEMLHYARADTHFLLHIYDQLRNALLEHSHTHPPLPPTPVNGTPPPDARPTLPAVSTSPYPWAITRVLARSATTAGRLYVPEIPNPAGLAKKWDLEISDGPESRSRSNSPAGELAKKKPIEQKAAVFEAVFWWRDKVARAEDESPIYVLANTALFQIASQAPTTLPALFKAVPRLSGPARAHAEGLVEAVIGAVEKAKKDALEWEKYLKEEERREEVKEMQEAAAAMVVDIGTSFSVAPSADLWSRLGPVQNAPTKLARSSSLFGSTLASQPQKPQLKQKAAQSTLFRRSSLFSAPEPAPAQSPFEELRKRIHGAISEAPRMAVPDPEPMQVEQEQEAEPEPQAASDTLPKPAPSKPTFLKPQLGPTSEVEADDVVVVAQPRSKSKKRTPQSGSGPGAKKARASPVPEFDYASAPSILDQPVEEETGKKEKEKKKVASIYGNFPAPPKAQSEQRSGNRTFTFK